MNLGGQSALESLSRDPNEAADEKGGRTIRHFGGGSVVISKVDPKGRLLRQEAILGRDVIIWQHATRLRTGALKKPSESALDAAFDEGPSRPRLERVRNLIGRYLGRDKYLQHLDRVVKLHAGLTFTSAEVVTESISNRLRMRWAQRKRRVDPGPGRGTRLALIAAAVLALLGLAGFVARSM